MNYLVKTLSGHIELSQIEISTLTAPYDSQWLTENLCSVTCTEEKMNEIIQKSGGLRLVLDELCMFDTTDFDEILKQIDECRINLPEGNSFAARVYKINEPGVIWHSSTMERKLGGRIFKENDDLQVNLKKPDFIFALLIWNKGAAIGFVKVIVSASRYNWKAPKHLPYFRGGAIKPLIARFIVNMHALTDGDYVIDPFCGHGGTLFEIADVGYQPIGIELDRKVLRQAQYNAKSINYLDKVMLLMGDALHPPLRKQAAKYYVTDPPYSIQTTTQGKGTEHLLLNWFANLEVGAIVAYATPNTVLTKLPKYIKILKSAEDFVHKTLSRRMRLVKKWTTS